MIKEVDALTLKDFLKHPVWGYVSAGETMVQPANVPATKLNGKVIGTEVLLANGAKRWAILGNINLKNAQATKHFLTLSVEKNGVWFHLARYHDIDRSIRGPDKLANFLGIPQHEVFPIQFDISAFVRAAKKESCKGVIEGEPKERLSKTELIDLALS